MHVAVDKAGDQGMSGKVDDALVSAGLAVGDIGPVSATRPSRTLTKPLSSG
jgi:hypothetical protein